MNVAMNVTTRLACAAAVLGACGSPSVKHMTQQEMIAADPLPLARGATWTYNVVIKRFEVDAEKETTRTLTWVTEVVDARSAGGVTAYRVKGWPADLADLDQASPAKETFLLRSGNEFLFGASAEPTLEGAQGWFNWPVVDGQRICPNRMVYCWQISAIDTGYALKFITGPDEEIFELEPGTGVSRFHYAHHGSTNEVEARLVAYTKGAGH
jgi:hypothetical protein